VRVCIVYDCLYPYTIGGAERWYRNLGERLAAEGHDLTFLTLRQWEPGEEPSVPGARVVAAGPRMALYTARGRRRLLPPLVFGAGVLLHLLRHGRRYDVVHTASFPYFSLLAASWTGRRGRFRLVVDWHEVWTREYWREYLGGLSGRIGWRVQKRCLRVQQRAFCFSKLHERRLRELGLTGELTRLEGQYAGPVADEPRPARPVAVFAGRLIPEKRAASIPAAIAKAREQVPDIRGEIYGDGPEREPVLRAIADAGVDGAVNAPGFVSADVLEEARSTALCLLLPSSREGYGLVVLEAAARGVPAVVCAGADNAATELVEEGVSGWVAPSASADDLAAAIVRVHEAGPELRRSTLDWFRRNAERLLLETSLTRVLAGYADASARS
jgi:glycosyltransferase involved in cell wall biosynthesis